MHFKRIQFRNFKSFKSFSVSLAEFNVLVGPNNAGKSTVISSFRLLSEGIKRANKKKPNYFKFNNMDRLGYKLDLTGLPVATENVFFNYDDSEPALITFTLSTNDKLILYFPDVDECFLSVESKNENIDSPAKFRKVFKGLSIGFVPVLGPVARNERFFQQEAARLALQSYTASRNFRNIWYHYSDGFDEFRQMVKRTWPTMDIEKPKLEYGGQKPELVMFCPEERIPREIFWAGFGFQVWCQMLTFILKSKGGTILLIDEPDIYLHSDLQKQLVSILKDVDSDVIIATHSTEIISEVEPTEILIINKIFKSAKRIKSHTQLNPIFNALGSNLNPILTQIAKTKKVLFLEGKDFKIIGQFARKLGRNSVANQSNFAIIPSEGFNPGKVENVSKGIEFAIGDKLICGVIFDSDYRCQIEKDEIIDKLKEFSKFASIHDRKEIENYLIITNALERTIIANIENHNKRAGTTITYEDNICDILLKLTKEMKHDVISQYLVKEEPYKKIQDKGKDSSTLTKEILKKYEEKWENFEDRMKIVPGKELLSKLNGYLQDEYKVTVTASQIIKNMKTEEIDPALISIIENLNNF